MFSGVAETMRGISATTKNTSDSNPQFNRETSNYLFYEEGQKCMLLYTQRKPFQCSVGIDEL